MGGRSSAKLPKMKFSHRARAATIADKANNAIRGHKRKHVLFLANAYPVADFSRPLWARRLPTQDAPTRRVQRGAAIAGKDSKKMLEIASIFLRKEEGQVCELGTTSS